MEEHQRRIVGQIASEVDEYRAGRRSLQKLVENVQGLFQAAEIRDRDLGEEFYLLWIAVDSELELRTAEWSRGEWIDDDSLSIALTQLQDWAVAISASEGQAAGQ